MDSKISDSFYGCINYHENKLDQGKAEIISSSFGDLSRLEAINYLDAVASLNTNTKIKGLDIPISFLPGEKITKDMVKNIWDDYAREMGFEDRPYRIYRHYDQEHPHFHVVVSNVDLEGVPNPVLRGMYKRDGIAVCREIEKKYNLVQLRELGEGLYKSQKEINAEKYAFHNAVVKGLKERNDLLGQELSYLEKTQIKQGDLSLDGYKKLLGENRYDGLIDVMVGEGLLKKSNKRQLIEVLEKHRIGSRGRNDYLNKVKEEGLYVRVVGEKDRKYLKYGMTIEGKKHYLNENDLPERFRLAAITNNSLARKHSLEKQRSYLTNNIKRVLRSSKSYDSFKSTLASKYKIKVIEHSNSSRVYGLSFISEGSANAVQFKGGDLSRSFTYGSVQGRFKKDHNPKVDFTRDAVSSFNMGLYASNNREQLSSYMKDRGFTIDNKDGGVVVSDDANSLSLSNLDKGYNDKWVDNALSSNNPELLNLELALSGAMQEGSTHEIEKGHRKKRKPGFGNSMNI